MKIRNGGARVAFYSIAAASVVGCQVTGEEFPDTEPPQCVTREDCENIGGDFRGRICSSEGVCVRNPNPPPLPPRDYGCISDDQCASELGYPSKCPVLGTKCIQIGNASCSVRGDWRSPSAIFFGVDLSRDAASREPYEIATRAKQSSDFATAELIDQMRGVPRVPVWVSCQSDAGEDFNAHWRNVGVSAIVTRTDAATLRAAKFFDGKMNRATPILCADCTADVRTDSGASASNLYQRSQPLLDSLPMAADILRDLEKRRIDAGVTSKLRVSVFAGSGSIAARDRIAAGLAFNGVGLNENVAAGNATFSDPRLSSGAVDADALQTMLLSTNPEVVVLYADAYALFPLIEATIPKVRYIVMGSGATLHEMASAVGTSADLAARVAMVESPLGVATDSSFESGGLKQFRSFVREPAAVPNWNVYESVYIAAFAAATNGAGLVTNEAYFRDAINRMSVSTAKPLVVGPSSLVPIVSSLSSGGNVNLLGVTSALGIDAAKGSPLGGTTSSRCGKGGGVEIQWVQNTRTYSTKTGTFSGVDLCPLPL